MEKESKGAKALTKTGILGQLPRLTKRIADCLRKSGLSLDKLITVYQILVKAVEDIEAEIKAK